MRGKRKGGMDLIEETNLFGIHRDGPKSFRFVFRALDVSVLSDSLSPSLEHDNTPLH